MRRGKLLKLALMNAAFVVGLVGCASKAEKPVRGEAFPNADEPQAARQIASMQISAGAKADPTLYAVHFDGAELNSLGQRKVEAMCDGLGEGERVVIHLATGDIDMTYSRQQSVRTHLEICGVSSEQIQFADGTAQAAQAPASHGLTRLARTENTGTPETRSGRSGATEASSAMGTDRTSSASQR